MRYLMLLFSSMHRMEIYSRMCPTLRITGIKSIKFDFLQKVNPVTTKWALAKVIKFTLERMV